MKPIKFLFLLLILSSCSNDDDCASKRKAINDQIDRQLRLVYENPPVSQNQIQSLNEERDRKLAKACD